MQSVYEWFLKIVQNCKTWYYHFILSEATKAEVDEWFEEQERQHAEEEAEVAKWHADYIRQQEQVLADQLAEEEEYARQREEREELKQQLDEYEQYKSFCPLCGTRWGYPGKCKPCDRAFGHD
jgi:DNA repair exonuclease SbcCD ATPase subunit